MPRARSSVCITLGPSRYRPTSLATQLLETPYARPTARQLLPSRTTASTTYRASSIADPRHRCPRCSDTCVHYPVNSDTPSRTCPRANLCSFLRLLLDRTALVLVDERELAVGFNHPDLHVGEIGDPLLPGGVAHIVFRQPFDLQNFLERSAVVDDEHGDPFEDRPRTVRSKTQIRERHHQQCHRGHCEHGPDNGAIVSGHSLLNQIAHHDKQDQLERGHLRQLVAAQSSGDEPYEEEERSGTHDDLHQGTTTVLNRTRTTGRPSITTPAVAEGTSCTPDSVAASMETMKSSPEGGSNAQTIIPLPAFSEEGCGASELMSKRFR